MPFKGQAVMTLAQKQAQAPKFRYSVRYIPSELQPGIPRGNYTCHVNHVTWCCMRPKYHSSLCSSCVCAAQVMLVLLEACTAASRQGSRSIPRIIHRCTPGLIACPLRLQSVNKLQVESTVTV